MEQYFSQLNYSMANEDSSFEYQLVKKYKPKKIVAVCGSGGRALPLLHENIKELICVDLAKQQLLLLELRIEGIKIFSLDQFKLFWGYPPYSPKDYCQKRESLFNKLSLGELCFHYFENEFLKNNWRSLLFVGKWESTFVSLSKIAHFMLGKNIQKMFSFSNLEKQREYFDHHFPWFRWNILLHIVGNKSFFNALLYKGHFVKKNIDQTYFDFYSQAYGHLFYQNLCKESFFLQLCFLGKIVYEQGNTIEVSQKCFETMKKLICEKIPITFINDDLIKTIKGKKNIDFISMSDVPSYFSGDVEKNFLQDIKPSLSPNAIIVIRSYLRVPNCNRNGYLDITDKFRDLMHQEKVQMYKIEVLQNG